VKTEIDPVEGNLASKREDLNIVRVNGGGKITIGAMPLTSR
jgi:hypothetical protein